MSGCRRRVLMCARPYAAVNPAIEPELPSTFGYSIAPPGDAAPTTYLDAVYPALLGASPADVSLMIAVVRNETSEPWRRDTVGGLVQPDVLTRAH